MSVEIIAFVPRSCGRKAHDTPVSFHSPARPDDLVMDHADTAPCEYSPWRDARHADDEPA